MATALAACGSAGNANNASSAPAQNTAAPERQSAETVELTISAAASLTNALKEIQKSYEATNGHIKLSFNFGASGALQQQIENGAPVDLFLSATVKNMAELVDKGLIDESRHTNLLNNELVVVVPVDGKVSIEAAEDLTKAEVKTVAIGIPESVPAGN